MARIRVRDAARFLGVSDDTVRRWIDNGTLTALKDDAGRRVVDGLELATLARSQSHLADPTNTAASSARNHFPGLITRIVSDQVMSQVELQCGPFRVVSLMSTEAVTDLGLNPGDIATAVIKATNVIVTTSGLD